MHLVVFPPVTVSTHGSRARTTCMLGDAAPLSSSRRAATSCHSAPQNLQQLRAHQRLAGMEVRVFIHAKDEHGLHTGAGVGTWVDSHLMLDM